MPASRLGAPGLRHVTFVGGKKSGFAVANRAIIAAMREDSDCLMRDGEDPSPRPLSRPVVPSLGSRGVLMLATLLAVLLSTSRPARGETLEEAGLWVMAMMEGSIGGQKQRPSRFRWWLDIQPRFLENVSGLQQGLFRPGVGYVLGDSATAWIGYARVYTSSASGATSNEDRIWQQYLWKRRVGEIGFQSRTRLEQRFLDTGSDTGWRFRQFVKVSWKFPNESRFSLVAYDEVFLDLNRTDWGQRSGFAQNRLFVGVGMKLDARGRRKLEIGYLNQYLDGAGPNRMNHILSINFFFKF